MTVADLIRCSKPLIFEENDSEYTYTGGGTFFLGRYLNNYFGITAKHCLYRRDKNSIRLTFDELSETEDRFLVLKSVVELQCDYPERDGCLDMSILQIDRSTLSNEQMTSNFFLDFDYLINQNDSVGSEDQLITRGYPNLTPQGEIDYDKKIIKSQGYSVEGRFSGVGKEPFTFFVHTEKVSIITDTNGMSGSPVFGLKKIQNQSYYYFAGFITKGATTVNHHHFQVINKQLVFKALKKIYDN